MAKYQVWEKSKLGQRSGTFATEHYTLDFAMDSAKDLSRGTVKKQVWQSDPKDPWAPGKMIDVDEPAFYCVVERGDRASVVRGWGIGGVWYDARSCKRCNDTGNDTNAYGLACASCKGASYKPKV